jgi:hypothetical protein
MVTRVSTSPNVSAMIFPLRRLSDRAGRAGVSVTGWCVESLGGEIGFQRRSAASSRREPYTSMWSAMSSRTMVSQ